MFSLTNTVIEEVDNWDEIFSRLETLGLLASEVGYYQEDKHEGSGLAMSDLALVHERGRKDGSIPSRPFMFKAGIIDAVEKQPIYSKILGKVITGHFPALVAWEMVAEISKESLQDAIDGQDFEALNKTYAARKGSDLILIDTNGLYKAGKAKVVSSLEALTD